MKTKSLFLIILTYIFVLTSCNLKYNIPETDVCNINQSDMSGTIRIEYLFDISDENGGGKIYRHSYNKNEIQEFLSFFEGTKLIPESQYEQFDGNIYWNRDDDYHVMIRHMDSKDSNQGYYVCAINIIDEEDYSRVWGRESEIYRLPDGLREFVEKNTYTEGSEIIK